MKNYLVTGGAGFIGSNIVSELVRRGEKVKVIDNFSFGKRENLNGLIDKIELIEGDIRDRVALRRAIEGCDYVIHQAALRSVPTPIRPTAPLLSREGCHGAGGCHHADMCPSWSLAVGERNGH